MLRCVLVSCGNETKQRKKTYQKTKKKTNKHSTLDPSPVRDIDNDRKFVDFNGEFCATWKNLVDLTKLLVVELALEIAICEWRNNHIYTLNEIDRLINVSSINMICRWRAYFLWRINSTQNVHVRISDYPYKIDFDWSRCAQHIIQIYYDRQASSSQLVEWNQDQ